MAPELENTIETQGVLGRARAIPKQWSIHSGTTSAHTKQSFWDHKCAHKSFTEEPGIQTSLTLAYQPTTSDGARVEPIFLHLKRWQEGTSDTKKELYYQGGTHSGTTSAHTNLLPSGTPSTPVLDLRHTSAYNWPTTNGTQVHQLKKKTRKGTGDTKTEWHYLVNTNFGTTGPHTNISPRNPKYRSPGALLPTKQQSERWREMSLSVIGGWGVGPLV
jgi:hypothetical protein